MLSVCPQCGRTPPDNAVVCPHDGRELMTAEADPLLGTVVGSWRVVQRLGTGGMGSVYEAVETTIDKRVALKIVHPHLSGAKDLPSLVAEAKAVNSIGDRGIVDIFGFGQLDDGRQYLVMELLQGEPLDAILIRKKQLPLDELFAIADPLLGALHAAHQAGFVHRDIKTSNVFVVKPSRGESYPKLLDFGIAERVRSQSGTRVGTPNYVSPEQAEGREIGPRADLYSFGCMLFELLAGVPPFADPDVNVVLDRHRFADRPSLKTFRSDVSPELDHLVQWMMRVDPNDRPASAAVVQHALRQLLAPKLPRATSKLLLLGLAAVVLAVAAVAVVMARRQAAATPEDPLAKAVAQAVRDVEARLDAGQLADSNGAVDQLLVAQQSFPNRPELDALEGTAVRALRLRVIASIEAGELGDAESLLAALHRLAPLREGETDEQTLALERGRFAKRHGMVRVGSLYVDAYEYPNQAGAKPANDVDHDEALALCSKQGKHLCSESEWHDACVGASKRGYAYGDVFEKGRCHGDDDDGKAVAEVSGARKTCVTAEGLFDLSGNVAEWTSSAVREGAPQKVIRGGSFAQSDAQQGCEARDYYLPGLGGAKHIGFRCCY